MGFRKLFATFFDEEIYNFAKVSYEKNNYFPMRECYAILAITKVIEDVMVSSGSVCPSVMQSMDRFICRNHYAIYESYKTSEIIVRLKDYITCRLDMKLSGNEVPDLEVVSVSDQIADISKPEWFQKNGRGIIVQSYTGILDISLKTSTGGNLMISLRGKDVRDKEGNRIPYWIDYTNIRYNDKIVSEDVNPAWHDKPVRLEYPVKAGDIVRLHLEWLPHRSDSIDIKEVKTEDKQEVETEDKQEVIQIIENPEEKEEPKATVRENKIFKLFHKKR